jgi:peroxiredoxin/outer membrane lipoprotein-sorting protein
MKRKINQLLTLIVVALFAVACGSPTEEKVDGPVFSIAAKIDTLDAKMAYLSKYKDGNFVKLDSSVIDSGRFSFAGMVKLPNVQYLMFDEGKEKIAVFVENSVIAIEGTNLDPENYTILGSEIQDQLTVFKTQVKKYDEKLKVIVKEYYAAKEDGDEALLESVDAKYNNEDSLKRVFIEAYIEANLNSVIAPYLSTRYMMGKEVEELVLLNSSFSDSIRGSEYVLAIEERVTILQNSAVGQPAPIFAMNDKDGNSIALESFKGKYVLVDFWASWCGPCRGENPNVVAAYKKYHEKGFEILGVSFDENKERWLKAVDDDGLTWAHVSDLKGWDNAVGKIYGVRSIPHSVLINKEGVIIAKDLRGEELHEKLEEIFLPKS